MESAENVSIPTSGHNDLENSVKCALEGLKDSIAEVESPGGTETDQSRCSTYRDEAHLSEPDDRERLFVIGRNFIEVAKHIDEAAAVIRERNETCLCDRESGEMLDKLLTKASEVHISIRRSKKQVTLSTLFGAR